MTDQKLTKPEQGGARYMTPRNDSPVEIFNKACERAWIMAGTETRLQLMRFVGGFAIDDCLLYLNVTLEAFPNDKRKALVDGMRRQAEWVFGNFKPEVVRGVA